jgi:hypothetical protein
LFVALFVAFSFDLGFILDSTEKLNWELDNSDHTHSSKEQPLQFIDSLINVTKRWVKHFLKIG